MEQQPHESLLCLPGRGVFPFLTSLSQTGVNEGAEKLKKKKKAEIKSLRNKTFYFDPFFPTRLTFYSLHRFISFSHRLPFSLSDTLHMT